MLVTDNFIFILVQYLQVRPEPTSAPLITLLSTIGLGYENSPWKTTLAYFPSLLVIQVIEQKVLFYYIGINLDVDVAFDAKFESLV